MFYQWLFKKAKKLVSSTTGKHICCSELLTPAQRVRSTTLRKARWIWQVRLTVMCLERSFSLPTPNHFQSCVQGLQVWLINMPDALLRDSWTFRHYYRL